MALMLKKKFLIVTPSYNENIGGVIALHLLCHRINSLGRNAYLWDINRPIKASNTPLQLIRLWWRNKKYQKRRLQNGFYTNPDWQTPEIDNIKNINHDDWVIIYPEIIQDNPLKALNIVRWFLYLPRYSSYNNIGAKTYLNISYSESCKRDLNDLILHDEILCVTYIHKAYIPNKATVKKEGIAYQIRKHDSLQTIEMPEGSINIDKLNHFQIAEIFNKVEYFYSYDLYSFYSIYASLCGCKSIVIPKEGLSEADWRPREEDRFGIAYGTDKLDWALSTRDKLTAYLDKKQDEEMAQLDNFIKLCDAKFS